jgi:Domain of unknown function (DUF397)
MVLTRPPINPEGLNVMLSDGVFTQWRKSSLSSGGDNCVEVGFAMDGRVAVRDTKQNGDGPVLVFFPSEWEAFLGGVAQGEFDRA